MENNPAPPKEIEVTESFPFIIHKGCIYQFKDEVPEGATILNAPNVDTAMGYLSEQSVNEMLAEKDRRINTLLERIKFRDDQIDICANNILSMNADLKAKDKEIERLKSENNKWNLNANRQDI